MSSNSLSRQEDSVGNTVPKFDPSLKKDQSVTVSLEENDWESDNEEQEEEYHKILRKVDLRLLVPYSFAYVFTQINKNNISNVAILNQETGNNIRHELGDLTSEQWAWCISIFYYPYLFFEAILTLCMKLVGPRPWQSRIMLTWGGFSMLQAATKPKASELPNTSKGYGLLLAVRFFLGLSEALFFTSVLYHYSYWVPARLLSQRTAIFYSWGMLSGAVSGILAYGISFLNQKGVAGHELSGWQYVFLFEGIPTILIGIYLIFFLPNYIPESKFLTGDQKQLLLKKLQKTAPKKDDKTFSWSDIKLLLKQSHFYSFTGIWLFQGIGGWGISYSLPTVIYDLGFTGTAETQLLSMPPSIAGFILLNILGFLLQRQYIKVFPVAFVMTVLQIGCYIVLISTKNNAAKYSMLIIATAISNSLYPVLWPDRIRVAKGASSGTGLAIGFTNSITQLSGILGGQIYQSKFGPLYRVSYAISIVFCVLSCLSVALTWYLVVRDGLLETEGAEKDEEVAVKSG